MQENQFTFKDSLLGELLVGFFNQNLSNSTNNNLNEWILKNFQSSQLSFSSELQKRQFFMKIPNSIRIYIQKNETEKIANLFASLLKNENLDLILELTEWIVTSFENKTLSLEILNLLLKGYYSLQMVDLDEILGKYDAKIKLE